MRVIQRVNTIWLKRKINKRKCIIIRNPKLFFYTVATNIQATVID